MRNQNQELRDSEHQLRTLADSIPQLVWMAEPDGYIFWYNQRWYEYTGTTPEQMAGWGWQSVHDPEVLPGVLDKWRDSIRSAAPFEMEFPLRGSDGVFRWFLTRVVPLLDSQQNVQRWFGTNTDITDLRRTREEKTALLKREQEARSTAELLNRVGPLLVSQLELNKLVQSVTDLATTLTGAEFGAFFHNVTDEDNGESYMLSTLSGVPADSFAGGFPMPRNTAVFASTFSGEGILRSDDITQDSRYRKAPPDFVMPQGQLPVISYLAVPVVSRSGEVLGGLFFGHAERARFTEHHEAIVKGIAAQAAIAMDNATLFKHSQEVQQALQRSIEELRRANSDLETFAYSASHDLQEPLRNVAIYTQLLRRKFEGQLDLEGRQFLAGILEGALRMETLVRDVLAYSQAAKGMDGPVSAIDANGVISGVLQVLRIPIEEARAQVTVGELPTLSMGEVHLSQLFQNLIGNAIKYRSQEAPRVHVDAARQNGSWVFSVSDNGMGIDPKYRTQIFGLFKRLHTRQEHPGSGVGLAICKRMVEQYGGRIWVDAGDGGGSVFRFSIPDRSIR